MTTSKARKRRRSIRGLESLIERYKDKDQHLVHQLEQSLRRLQDEEIAPEPNKPKETN